MNTTGVDCPHCGAADLTEHGEGCPNQDYDTLTAGKDKTEKVTWRTPYTYVGSLEVCWACGLQSTQFVNLCSAHFSLCKVCTMILEAKVLEVASEHLKEQAYIERKELT